MKIKIQLTYTAISMQITNLMLNIYDECISNTNLNNFPQFIIYEIHSKKNVSLIQWQWAI